MIEFLGLIPARGGSKTIPRKNIKPLNGKPLIAYTIEAALKCGHIDRLIVSTDDEEIGKIAEHFGAEFLFLRPKELAQDSTGDAPVIEHAINWLATDEKQEIGGVVYLRPTTPFKTPEIISHCVQKIRNSDYTGLRTVTRVSGVHHPYWMYKSENGLLQPFCEGIKIENYFQRQLLPGCFRLNGVVDIILPSGLGEPNLYGTKIGFVEVEERFAIDVDNEFDFHLAEFLLKGGFRNEG